MTIPLTEYELLAQGRMDPAVFAYVAGGAGAEKVNARNRTAWDDIRIVPRLMQDLRGFSTASSLFGLDLVFPCLVAPMAFQRLADTDGEQAMAAAAASQGAGMVVSCQTSMPLAGGAFWFQLYMQPHAEDTVALVSHALRAGARGLVVTLDAPVNGIRPRETDAGFTLPEDVRPILLDALPPRSQPEGLAGVLAALPRWDDLARLCAHSPVPVIAKGVLSATDARRAIDAGCAGVIVSNHGGRVFDAAPATAEVLPSIRAACPDVPVLVDGGIRSGEDMLRALALGADAVLVGRPFYFALACGGASAAATAIRRLHEEFAVAMALCGVPTLADITADLVHRNE